jgi:hypothetical protein
VGSSLPEFLASPASQCARKHLPEGNVRAVDEQVEVLLGAAHIDPLPCGAQVRILPGALTRRPDKGELFKIARTTTR